MCDLCQDGFLWKELDDEETVRYLKWANENFNAGDIINPLWHPIVKHECRQIEARKETVTK